MQEYVETQVQVQVETKTVVQVVIYLLLQIEAKIQLFIGERHWFKYTVIFIKINIVTDRDKVTLQIETQIQI